MIMTMIITRIYLITTLLLSTLELTCLAFSSNSFLSSRSTPVKDSYTALSATWSNGQAIKEYQDFLASGKNEIESLSDRSSVIVSSNDDFPLVSALMSLGLKNDLKDYVIRPDSMLPDELDGSDSFPIYIAIPPTDLAEFLDNLPKPWMDKFDDFVFFSGGICGIIEPILRERGMCREAITQVETHGFSMPGAGRFPQDLSFSFGIDAQGNEKRGGETGVCGKWAGAISERFEKNFITVKTGFYRDWRRWMWEMAAYDAVFILVGAVRSEPTTLEQVALYYEEEAVDMLWQINNNLRGYLAVTLIYGFEDRVFEYAERNGKNVPCSLTSEMYPFIFEPFENSQMVCNYLTFAQKNCNFLQSMQLKESVLKFEAELNPKTRQGNLRSDGII